MLNTKLSKDLQQLDNEELILVLVMSRIRGKETNNEQSMDFRVDVASTNASVRADNRTYDRP